MRKNTIKKSLVIGIISMMTILTVIPVTCATSTPQIEITKPEDGPGSLDACWYSDNDIIAENMPNVRIWGLIDIEVDTFDDGDIEYVDFLVDDDYEYTDYSEPYEWKDADLPTGDYYITVKARDASHAILTTDSVYVIKIHRDSFVKETGEMVTMSEMLSDGMLLSQAEAALIAGLIAA